MFAGLGPIGSWVLMGSRVVLGSWVLFFRYAARGYFLRGRRLCMQNLTKERKQPPVVILHQATFHNIFIPCLWLRSLEDLIKVFSSWIFFQRYFLSILIMVTEQLYWRKVLCGCFRLIWLWLLIAIMKKCVERCTLQLYRTSLKETPAKLFLCKYCENFKNAYFEKHLRATAFGLSTSETSETVFLFPFRNQTSSRNIWTN